MAQAPDLNSQFDRVFVHRDSLGSRLAERVHLVFPAEKIEIVDEKPLLERHRDLTAREFSDSKRLLYITPFRGSFFKQCPGSKGVACCNYFVLNLGLQCNMNCSYCYLQSYINTPVLTLYSNLDDALDELRVMGESFGDLPYRIGTGEVTDSLSLDPLTLFSHELIEFFRSLPKWTLEFKTKSDCVDQFLSCEHAGNVHVSWSINPDLIVRSEEHGTASLSERLAAARKCRDRGFPIAFHLDPMIWFPEWEEHYLALVDEIADRFTPDEVPSITVGALRFRPEQRAMMRERFGLSSRALQGELFPSADGKLRYDFRLRNQMFQTILKRFKDLDPRWNAWLCMENVDSWITTMKASPRLHPQAKTFFQPLPAPSPSNG